MRNPALPGAAALAAASAIVAASLALPAAGAPAAVNPVTDEATAHALLISADGTVAVHTEQTVELGIESTFDFGGTVHDGFRLPDSGTVLPPYLRASYSDATITIDGASTEAAPRRVGHAVTIETRRTLGAGSHTSRIDYEVSGAAVPDDAGIVVRYRPLTRGDVMIKAEAPIASVDCEEWPTDGETCGRAVGDGWIIAENEYSKSFERRTVMAIRLESDPARLPDPTIDTGSSETTRESGDDPAESGGAGSPPESGATGL